MGIDDWKREQPVLDEELARIQHGGRRRQRQGLADHDFGDGGPWVAEHQPFTPIVETLRGLLMGTPIGNDAWIALGWCVGLLVLAYVVAVRTYKHKIA